MPELQVKVRTERPDVAPGSARIPVFDGVPAASHAYDHLGVSRLSLGVNRMPYTRQLPVMDNSRVPAHPIVTFISIPVVLTRSNGMLNRTSQLIKVFDAEPSAVPYVRPADADSPPDDGPTRTEEINLSLDVSFDSYFKFGVTSDDGIRAVLDEKNSVLPSGNNGYEIEASRIGQQVRRKIITSSDLALTLRLNPTIVKGSSPQ